MKRIFLQVNSSFTLYLHRFLDLVCNCISSLIIILFVCNHLYLIVLTMYEFPGDWENDSFDANSLSVNFTFPQQINAGWSHLHAYSNVRMQSTFCDTCECSDPGTLFVPQNFDRIHAHLTGPSLSGLCLRNSDCSPST